jgi:predicted regulator of Ras-like GTPase activity (Roadblock/LC7/MglB family)
MAESIAVELKETLRVLRGASPYIMGSAVVTSEGFVIASELPDETTEKKVTIMAMAMLTLGQETTSELDSSDLERVLVESKDSYIVLINAGPSAVLAAVANKEAVLGLLFLATKKAVAEIKELLYQ